MILCPMQGKEIIPLGVFSCGNHVYLYSQMVENGKKIIRMDESPDGFKFELKNNTIEIFDKGKSKIDVSKCRSFNISENGSKKLLTYKYPNRKTSCLYGAFSADLISWKKTGKISSIEDAGFIVPDYKAENQYILYFGESSIGVALSSDLKNWQVIAPRLIAPFQDFYGVVKFEVANAFVTDEGIILLYYSKSKGKGFTKYSILSALFDKNNPSKMIRKIEEPVFESPEDWVNKNIEPIGIVWFKGKFISYWASENEGIYSIVHDLSKKRIEVQKKKHVKVVLKKSVHNPILTPDAENFWESKATFNPAAVYEDKKVHLVYRAIGQQDVSVLGYATSKDGVHIDFRSKDPIYVPTEPFESSNPYSHTEDAHINAYTSGGGCFGGCEDPRLSKVGKRYYMTYVAYNGWGPPRVALTSIKVEDFLNHNWNWDKPVLISKPGIVDKNACVLSEKINGKYVIFHRIFPNILVDYVDSLDFDGNTFLKGEHMIEPNYNSWDSRKVGVGAPPIKTEDGWLVIYHAVGDHDSSRYKMGAMVLDHNDLTKVLYRTKSPILEPHEWYENEGYKSGVAYPCGAVAMEKDLHIYYGGADSVVCVATANLNDFLTHIKTSGTADLVSIIG
jgi:beta-1,2-mannobiose phosphorylase / 1,2-beta-oligomannan phosphorylase